MWQLEGLVMVGGGALEVSAKEEAVSDSANAAKMVNSEGKE